MTVRHASTAVAAAADAGTRVSHVGGPADTSRSRFEEIAERIEEASEQIREIAGAIESVAMRAGEDGAD